jgi:hypothetical protein
LSLTRDFFLAKSRGARQPQLRQQGISDSALCARSHNVEASHSFHNLLLYRDWEFGCILEEFAPIKPLQVQLIGMYVAALLSA